MSLYRRKLDRNNAAAPKHDTVGIRNGVDVFAGTRGGVHRAADELWTTWRGNGGWDDSCLVNNCQARIKSAMA
jgi:hypothetical protein